MDDVRECLDRRIELDVVTGTLAVQPANHLAQETFQTSFPVVEMSAAEADVLRRLFF